MSVSSVDDDGISTCVNKRLHAVKCISGHTHSCRNTQTSFLVLACHWFVFGLGNVLICDKSYKMIVFVDYRELFNLVLL